MEIPLKDTTDEDKSKREIVNISNLSVYFNEVPAIENINLSIKENDFLAIIGPNGGGKTTLIKVILGLIKPDKGKVTVFGKNPEEGRKFIGYVPQKAFFDPKFPISVYEVVLLGRYKKIFRNYSNEDKEMALHALETVHMLEYKDKQIGSLSGGQIQRVLVARAITRNPSLLLLDEPVSNIDPKMQESFYNLLLQLKKKMAVVLVTHDIGAVSSYVEKIACLNTTLFYHGTTEGGLGHLEGTYKCPIELISHGVPHRMLKKHEK